MRRHGREIGARRTSRFSAASRSVTLIRAVRTGRLLADVLRQLWVVASPGRHAYLTHDEPQDGGVHELGGTFVGSSEAGRDRRFSRPAGGRISTDSRANDGFLPGRDWTYARASSCSQGGLGRSRREGRHESPAGTVRSSGRRLDDRHRRPCQLQVHYATWIRSPTSSKLSRLSPDVCAVDGRRSSTRPPRRPLHVRHGSPHRAGLSRSAAACTTFSAASAPGDEAEHVTIHVPQRYHESEGRHVVHIDVASPRTHPVNTADRDTAAPRVGAVIVLSALWTNSEHRQEDGGHSGPARIE